MKRRERRHILENTMEILNHEALCHEAQILQLKARIETAIRLTGDQRYGDREAMVRDMVEVLDPFFEIRGELMKHERGHTD